MIRPAGRVMRPRNPRAWACRFGGQAFVAAVRGCLAPPSDARPLRTFPRWACAHIQRITQRHSAASAGRSTLVALVIAAAVASALPVGALGSVAAGPKRSGRPTLTAQRLEADLVAGARTRRIPADLSPPLAVAWTATPVIARDGCNVPRDGVKSRGCVFGDTKSHTTVVLFGDSHAAAWFPALDEISRQQHWRLVVLTKDGCPPAEVKIAAWFRHGAPYWECSVWRANAEAQIARLHPALVIMGEARYLEVPETTPVGGASGETTWLNGLASIFGFLRQSASHVVFMSDSPTLNQRAPACVASHRTDVQFCSTSLATATRLPDVKAQELQIAAQDHVTAIDPTGWFCTPTTCPVIVNHTLLYRDNAHMVPEWSHFLAPLLAGAIVPVLRPRPGQG